MSFIVTKRLTSWLTLCSYFWCTTLLPLQASTVVIIEPSSDPFERRSAGASSPLADEALVTKATQDLMDRYLRLWQALPDRPTPPHAFASQHQPADWSSVMASRYAVSLGFLDHKVPVLLQIRADKDYVSAAGAELLHRLHHLNGWSVCYDESAHQLRFGYQAVGMSETVAFALDSDGHMHINKLSAGQAFFYNTSPVSLHNRLSVSLAYSDDVDLSQTLTIASPHVHNSGHIEADVLQVFAQLHENRGHYEFGSLHSHSDAFRNRGTMNIAGHWQAHGKHWDNGGDIHAGSVDLRLRGDYLQRGTLKIDKNLAVRSRTYEHESGLTDAQHITIKAKEVDHRGGRIQAPVIEVNGGRHIITYGGEWLSRDSIDMTTSLFANKGTLQSDDKMRLTVTKGTNAGVLRAPDTKLRGDFDNHGELVATKRLETNKLENHDGGLIVSEKDYVADSLTNAGIVKTTGKSRLDYLALIGKDAQLHNHGDMIIKELAGSVDARHESGTLHHHDGTVRVKGDYTPGQAQLDLHAPIHFARLIGDSEHPEALPWEHLGAETNVTFRIPRSHRFATPFEQTAFAGNVVFHTEEDWRADSAMATDTPLLTAAAAAAGASSAPALGGAGAPRHDIVEILADIKSGGGVHLLVPHSKKLMGKADGSIYPRLEAHGKPLVVHAHEVDVKSGVIFAGHGGLIRAHGMVKLGEAHGEITTPFQRPQGSYQEKIIDFTRSASIISNATLEIRSSTGDIKTLFLALDCENLHCRSLQKLLNISSHLIVRKEFKLQTKQWYSSPEGDLPFHKTAQEYGYGTQPDGGRYAFMKGEMYVPAVRTILNIMGIMELDIEGFEAHGTQCALGMKTHIEAALPKSKIVTTPISLKKWTNFGTGTGPVHWFGEYTPYTTNDVLETQFSAPGDMTFVASKHHHDLSSLHAGGALTIAHQGIVLGTNHGNALLASRQEPIISLSQWIRPLALSSFDPEARRGYVCDLSYPIRLPVVLAEPPVIFNGKLYLTPPPFIKRGFHPYHILRILPNALMDANNGRSFLRPRQSAWEMFNEIVANTRTQLYDALRASSPHLIGDSSVTASEESLAIVPFQEWEIVKQIGRHRDLSALPMIANVCPAGSDVALPLMLTAAHAYSDEHSRRPSRMHMHSYDGALAMPSLDPAQPSTLESHGATIAGGSGTFLRASHQLLGAHEDVRSYHSQSGKTSTEITTVSNTVTRMASRHGPLVNMADVSMLTQATEVITAGGNAVLASPRYEDQTPYDSLSIVTTSRKKTGTFKTTKRIIQDGHHHATPLQSKFLIDNGAGQLSILSAHLLLPAPQFEAIHTTLGLPGGSVSLPAVATLQSSGRTSTKAGLFRQSVETDIARHTRPHFPSSTGTIAFQSSHITADVPVGFALPTTGAPLALTDAATRDAASSALVDAGVAAGSITFPEGAEILVRTVAPVDHHEYHHHSAPGPLTQALMSLAASTIPNPITAALGTATTGTGAALQAAAGAALRHVAVRVALRQEITPRSIASAAIPAGLTEGLLHTAGLAGSAPRMEFLQTFARELKRAAITVPLTATTSMILDGEDFSNAVASSLRTGAADVVGATLSAHIGHLHHDGVFDEGMRYAAHGVSALAQTAIRDGHVRGGVGAVASAWTTELVGDALHDESASEAVSWRRNLAIGFGTTVGSLLDADPMTAMGIATNATLNTFGKHDDDDDSSVDEEAEDLTRARELMYHRYNLSDQETINPDILFLTALNHADESNPIARRWYAGADVLLDAVETGVSWGGRAVQLGAYAHGCWTGATTTLMKGGVPLNPRTLALKAIAGCGTGLAGVYATEKTFEHSVAPVLASGVEYAAHGVGSAVGSAAYLATGDGLFSAEVARIGTRAMGAVTGAYLVSRGARAFFHPNPLMERMTGESMVKFWEEQAAARARVGYSARLTSADFTVNPYRSVAARLESRPSVPWHRGIHERGMAYEDFVAQRFTARERLPQNFKTFDFHTRPAGVGISVKTLDTQTPSRLAKPERVYHSLKRSIDAVIDFRDYGLSGRRLLPKDIKVKEIQVGIPAQTNPQQWAQIEKAVDYARLNGITLKIEQAR